MSGEEDIKKLEELIERLEGYAGMGVSEPAQEKVIEAVVAQAEAIFNRIIDEYITRLDIPPVQQAYQVSDLQERFHRARHNLPSPSLPGESTAEIVTDKKVVIYTTPTCPWCRRAKEYFSRIGVAYTEYDVAHNRDRVREMVEKSGQMSVPVIIIDGQVIIGFNQSRLDSLLS